MAVALIPNQLVKLYDTETFNQRNKRLTLDYRQYCQLVRQEQSTMFQLRLLPDSDNLISNGDFQFDLSSWPHTATFDWASGRARAQYTTASAPTMYQIVAVTTGITYQLVFTVEFMQPTNVLTVTFGSQQQVFTAEDLGTGEHTITMYWNATQASVQIEFQLTAAVRGVIYIDDVEMYSLTEPTVRLETCTGDFVKTIPVLNRSDDYLTYSVDWYGLPEACYRVCIDGVDDTVKNFLDLALSLGTEGGAPIELEQGGYIKWFG